MQSEGANQVRNNKQIKYEQKDNIIKRMIAGEKTESASKNRFQVVWYEVIWYEVKLLPLFIGLKIQFKVMNQAVLKIGFKNILALNAGTL